MPADINPLDGIPPNATVLTPFEIVHVTGVIVENKTRTMDEKIDRLLDGFARLVGDDEDSDVPLSLRRKGTINEMREERKANFEIQKDWKAQNDVSLDEAKAERRHLANEIMAMSERVEVLELHTAIQTKNSHYIRRTVIWFIKYLTTKDDKVTVVVVKLGIAATFIAGSGATMYQGLKWTAMHAVKFIDKAMGVK